MRKNKNSFKNKKLKQKKLKALLIVATALVLAAGLFWYLQYDKSDSTKAHKDSTTIGPNTKGNDEPQNASGDEDQSNPSNSIDKTSAGPAGSQSSLKQPYGDFVSNHEPNLDGSPAPYTIESVCITTPGASCSISFKKGGIIKELPAQTADSEGAVYWDWKLQDYDLTEGTWTITAKAVLGYQTKTAQDPLNLNVKP